MDSHKCLQVLLHWVFERHIGALTRELGTANTALLVEVGLCPHSRNIQ